MQLSELAERVGSLSIEKWSSVTFHGFRVRTGNLDVDPDLDINGFLIADISDVEMLVLCDGKESEAELRQELAAALRAQESNNAE